MWNMDETRIPNMHVPGKVIAINGIRQVGKITNGERRTTFTIISAIDATSKFVLIFPRKRTLDQLIMICSGAVREILQRQWLNR